MTGFDTRVIIAALVLLAARPVAFQSPAPWAPGVQDVAAQSPPLDPAAALKTFRLPPGYRIELVASEPLIQDPILIDWDPDGRLWAIEMPGYMPDMTAGTELHPTGRIVVLEDVDGDGTMDRRTVFLDGLVLPRALKVLSDGVIVGAPPDLWLVRDTDGDLRADTRETISTAYGNRASGPEHNPNGLLWGLDNWIHTSQWNRMLRLEDGRVVVAPTQSRGQWGVTMDDAGRIYRNTNQAALFVDLVPARYYARHQGLPRTRGLFESLENFAVNTVWPIRPTRGVNRGYQTGVLRPNGTLAAFTSACAPTVYRGDRLPAELDGNVFVAEPAGNLVSRIVVRDYDGRLHGQKAYADAEFLTSTDERFRPVYLSSAPDGTLYVVDLYRGIIQHRTFITEYLRDYIVAQALEQPTGRGRIYRVVHRSTTRDVRPSLAGESSARLVDRLSHPNGWWRDTAQRLLVERGDASVVPRLRDRAHRARNSRARLHALWTLDGLNGLEPAQVERALADPLPDVRASAIRLAERWIVQPNHPLHAAIIARMDDTNLAVRWQLAATLGMLPAAQRSAPMAALLAHHGDDPIAVDAALSGLTSAERAALGPIPVPVARQARGATTTGRATAAVFGPPPPCPTCPGARGGPGGARAFPSSVGASGATRNTAAARSPLSETQRPDTEKRDGSLAGERIYLSQCAACHQADGRGGQGAAPPLFDSADRPASSLIRIVLHGKTGPTGLMPGLGALLTDDQVASALTYVRREGGWLAPAVSPDAVRHVRALTADRSTAWTDEELWAIDR